MKQGIIEKESYLRKQNAYLLIVQGNWANGTT